MEVPLFSRFSKSGPLPGGNRSEARQGVRILAYQKNQGSSLRIGFRSALFPLLQRSFVDAEFASEHRSRAAQLFSRVPDELGVHSGERRHFHLEGAQSELALPVALHGRHTLQQLAENISLRHQP